MKNGYSFLVLTWITLLVFSCKEDKSIHIPEPTKLAYIGDTLTISADRYYDKVLGALVGSAIGDAMGASTEMFRRTYIQQKYGYITALTPAIRQQSPEGSWDHNLEAGTTTDDTRWKYLMVKYIRKHRADMNATDFARFITNYYRTVATDLVEPKILTNPDELDEKIEKIDWIKEWARVAFAFQTGPKEYQEAQHRFYGGEMSCAGMLYTPVFGLVEPTPNAAYRKAYEHAIFDLGYAKDIAGLAAAMTHTAMRTQHIDSILDTAIFVDPFRYQDSRLVGRISYLIADASENTVLMAREIEQVPVKDSLSGILSPVDTLGFKIPKGYPGTTLEWVQQDFVYQALEKDEKAIAFHAAEIWQILFTALKFGEGDFEKTMQFIINYGRDNDTVAAVAGMILGAKIGYEKLPKALKEEVLRVNQEQMGLDLEALARELVAL
ncbi:ADP-ribosylglycohydrolase family protein [Flavobacteriaceae bacterium 3-367]|uniref:ADP-ribosylglycohydrolase family protein n=1 Tax=Eudoraea algarum TaxID=3417568 RepID=UPI003295CEEC